MTINQFEDCYEFAENGKHEKFWDAIYRKAFPNMTNQMLGKKEYCKSQLTGVDRIIYLENRKTITIDEKIRANVYADILLEYVSNDMTNSPGWMEKDLSIDYLAYAFLPVKTAYLFDWRMLKRAWDFYKEEWKKHYYTARAKNPTYTTLSVCVPIKVLTTACSTAAIIKV